MTTKATVRDLRAAGICHGAARAWFANHGMNWSEFVTGGLPAQEFRDTLDPFAIRLADEADKRVAREKSGG